MTTPRKIKFGVLGSSRVALKGMLPAIQSSELAELFMIGSRDPEKAKEIRDRFGAKESGSYDEVLKNKNIDVVYISLPNALHEEWSLKALQAGKNVICEKPAAISYLSAKNMVQVAENNNVRILEGLMYRHHPQNLKVKEMIKTGILGDLLSFCGSFAYAMPDFSSNAMNKNLGGGSFNDQACYPISASRMIFAEEPESVFCKIETDSKSGVSVKVDAMFLFPQKKSAFISSAFGSYYQSTYNVLGTKAQVRMGRAYAVSKDVETKIFLDQGDRVEEITVPPSDHFKNMLEDFAREILSGSKKTDYEKDLLAEARAMEAARISSEEKRVVQISEIK